MNRQPRLWIVSERPVRLPNALIAARSLRDRFPGGFYLIRNESPQWDRVQWSRYASYFDKVYAFPQVKSCRGLFDLSRLYRETTKRRSAVGHLPINPESDVLLCLGGVMGLGNVAAAAHRNVYKVLFISKSSYERLTSAPDQSRFRFTTSGWLQNRVVEPMAGIHRTLDLKPRVDPGGDGVRLVRLQKNPEDIYDTIVIASMSGRDLPRHGDGRFVTARYASITELPDFSTLEVSRDDRAKMVLFFGTPFLFIQNLTPELYIDQLNRCLDFIRRHYPGRDLIYRPHPIETNEAERLNLSGFRIEKDGEAAELYFLQHFAEIEAVYSVSSTVSRRASTYGLNAYSFWRCFPFPKTAAEFFEKLMANVPSEFEIRNLVDPPVGYQSSPVIEPNTRSFGDGLKAAMEMRPTYGAARSRSLEST